MKLCLCFNITDPITKASVDLKPGGGEIEVTNQNKMEYLSLFVYHKLDKVLEKAVLPFKSGFRKVAPLELVEIFNEEEFELIVSGGRAQLDIRDLQRSCDYVAGYNPTQKYIRTFWNELEKFSPREKQDFLKFVTSHDRPPLLGFAHLSPRFTIQLPEHTHDKTLPQAATCFNTLRLPKYSSTKIMVERLKEAIKYNTGFYLA